MGGFTVGKGIGKNNQGIVNPVEAVAKKDNICLGQGVFEEKLVKEKKEDLITDPEERLKRDKEVQKQKLDQEDKDFLALLKSSSKPTGDSKPFQRHVPHQQKQPSSYSQVKDFGLSSAKPTTSMKIIDMTTAATNYIDSSKFATTNIAKPVKALKNEGLFGKVLALKERIKHELQSAVNQKGYQTDVKVTAEYEKELVASRLENQRESLQILQHLKSQVHSRLVSPILTQKPDFNIPAECRELFTKYQDEYEQHKISVLAVKLIGANMIRPQISEWEVRREPKRMYGEYLDVGEILGIGKEDQMFGNNDSDDYGLNPKQITNDRIDDLNHSDVLYYLYDKYWLQKMRAYISTGWDVKESPRQFQEAIRDWGYLMPGRFLSKVVNIYLKPRLLREISQNWDPRDMSDKNRLENWLLIWSELLGPQNMQAIFVSAKLKIYQALNDWNCQDVELAKSLLLPWRGVIDHQSFDNMVVRVLIPRLTLSLKSLEIDPSNQDITPLQHIFAWEGIISDKELSLLLREHVLGKWLLTLQEWLSQVTESEDQDQMFAEIEQYYKGWRSIIPKSIISQHNISEVFKIGAVLIIEKAT
ncbi:hypothetical protein FGO68_gene17757 [Halteria grandinella]|uniref:G-patch domain-containing protein n=1 Tax=Halteria grandinella TaxID=5974 RepID=A0A8J8T5U9_HALGN|nr:hypothetical protein FGO68_gene17757 [Halteria grandinella]